MTQDPEKHELIHNVWHTGKRFYYFHYFWSSLFSGAHPFHFLHDLATDRVRDDIKDTLRHYGVEQKMITLPMMAGYLKSQIACDPTMPVDFKDVMVKGHRRFCPSTPGSRNRAMNFCAWPPSGPKTCTSRSGWINSTLASRPTNQRAPSENFARL